MIKVKKKSQRVNEVGLNYSPRYWKLQFNTRLSRLQQNFTPLKTVIQQKHLLLTHRDGEWG